MQFPFISKGQAFWLRQNSMQATGHVSLARLLGPGAADYNPAPVDADDELPSVNPRITFDELCDARSAPPPRPPTFPPAHSPALAEQID